MVDMTNTSMADKPEVSSSTLIPWTTHLIIPILNVDHFMGVLLVTTSIFGVFSNCIALKYFSGQRREISNIIYMSIVFVDVINSLLMFSPGVSYFKERQPFIMKYQWICNLWGIFFHITSRLSVFLVAALSLSRTVSLMFPFTRIRKIHVLIPVGVYILLLVGPALFPFYYGRTYM